MTGASAERYDGIPSTAYSVAENNDYLVFLNDEAVEDSIEGLPPVKQVSLWSYNKIGKKGVRILLSHPHVKDIWSGKDIAVNIPLDSIATISKVTILSWSDAPLKLLAEGCSDYRNIQSYIISEGSNTAICLPTNRGLVGVSEEDGFLIMQSYAYYEDGGRYNSIDVFDVNGKKISTMNLQVR